MFLTDFKKKKINESRNIQCFWEMKRKLTLDTVIVIDRRVFLFFSTISMLAAKNKLKSVVHAIASIN